MNDAGPNGLHLTLGGNAQLVADNLGWMKLPSGQLLRLQDLNDIATVSIPDSLIMDGTTVSPFTIEARIFPRAYKAHGVGNYPIVALRQTYESYLELIEGTWNEPAVPVVKSSGGEIVSDDFWAATVSTNAWHSLRMTFDVESLVEVYVDGLLLGVQPSFISPARNGDWLFTLGNFDGDIDEVRISNLVRTDTAATVAAGLIIASIPDSASVYGDTVEVPIYLTDATNENVLGIEASVAFNASTVTVLDTLVTSGSLTESGWFGASNIVPGIGGIDTLKIGLASAQNPLTGSGPLAFMQLLGGGVQWPDTTALQLPRVVFNEGTPIAGRLAGSFSVTVPPGLVVAAVPDTTAAYGDTLDVPIRLSDTTNEGVLGVEANIAYDASIVTVLETVITSGSLTQSGWFAASNIVAGIGGIDTLKIALASAQDPLVGDGPLAFMRLVARGNEWPVATALELTRTVFNEGTPTAAERSGSVAVTCLLAWLSPPSLTRSVRSAIP